MPWSRRFGRSSPGEGRVSEPPCPQGGLLPKSVGRSIRARRPGWGQPGSEGGNRSLTVTALKGEPLPYGHGSDRLLECRRRTTAQRERQQEQAEQGVGEEAELERAGQSAGEGLIGDGEHPQNQQRDLDYATFHEHPFSLWTAWHRFPTCGRDRLETGPTGSAGPFSRSAKRVTPTVHVRADVLEMIVGHARRAYPMECCGLLLGCRVDDRCEIKRIIESANIADGDRRVSYQIDWGVLLAATKASRSAEGRIIGFYHSHPSGPSEPSRTDERDAWLDHSYLIVACPRDSAPEVTSWRWTGDPPRRVRERVEVVQAQR